ncbi:hypothetical protein B0H14DRAFT_2599839 [Mycena olivaceomarginata]|nr:hypothetical protein B0H14DRAFT_2599839 [Mycena olivaceomarginata]
MWGMLMLFIQDTSLLPAGQFQILTASFVPGGTQIGTDFLETVDPHDTTAPGYASFQTPGHVAGLSAPLDACWSTGTVVRSRSTFIHAWCVLSQFQTGKIGLKISIPTTAQAKASVRLFPNAQSFTALRAF